MDEQVGRAVALLTRPENQRRFFEGLLNENWLGPLLSRGFFAKDLIPSRENVEGGKYFRFRPWPQSTYLVNIAPKAPKEVADVIVDLAGTDNVWVHQDFVSAALRMPPQEAKRIAAVVRPWLRSGIPTLVADKAATLTEMLAQHEPRAAFELANEFLDVWLPRVERTTDPETGISFPIHLEARSYVEAWRYNRFLTTEFRVLVNGYPREAVELLTKRLRALLELEERCSDKQRDDRSWIWYEDLEADSFLETTSRNALVAALRDAAKVVATKGASTQEAVLDDLSSQPCTVFLRIYLYLLTCCPVQQLSRVENSLRNSNLYRGTAFGPDLRRLLRVAYPHVSQETQAEFWRIIKRDPDLSNYRAWYKQRTGSEPDDDTCAAVAAQWRLPYVYAVRDFLPAESQPELAAAMKEQGWDESTGERPGPRAAAVGPRSPLTVDEIRQLGPVGLQKFLSEWDPEPPSFFNRASSPEGLGRTLATVVSEQPEAFAVGAEILHFENEPTYLRALVDGFAEALRRGSTVDWFNILRLCRWAADQPRDKSFEAGECFLRDPHWGWTRRSIVFLLERGFAANPPIPEDLSSAVWELLAILTNDPDPAPTDQWEYTEGQTDPTTHAMNTVRGAALIAVVKYLEWRAETIRAKGARPTLSGIPEVLPLLETKLDPKQERSLSVRSVLGQALPMLAYLDEAWVRNHMEALFNPGEEHKVLGQVVWESYLVHSGLRADLLTLFEPIYRTAIEQPPAKPLYTMRTPQQAVAEHVMVAFWWGLSDLASPDSLVSWFFRLSGDVWRAHAVSFLERSMRGQPTPAGEVRQRLQNLWQARLDAAEHSNATDQQKELAEFAPWGAIEWFETPWRLEMLRRTLRLTGGRADLAHLIADHLIAVSRDFPQLALQCLEAALATEDEGTQYHWRVSAAKILQNGFRSNDLAVRELATQIGNYLGERGFHEGTRPNLG